MEQRPLSNCLTRDIIEAYRSLKADHASMLETPSRPTLSNPPLDDSLLTAHAQFISALQKEKDPKMLTEIARLEVEAVLRLFPAEKSKNTRLALAAWLSYILALQDAVDAMTGQDAHPDNVRHDLSEAWKIFDGRRDCNLESDLGAFPSIEQPVNSLTHLSKALRKHLRGLLSARVIPVTFRHIRDVLVGFAEESLFRETKTWDIDHYLSIRTKTIGLRPWFAILMISDTSVPMSEADALMENLKTWVTFAIGLQNDIIGLERDLESKETMNFITVLRNQANYASANFLTRVVDAYDKETRTAIIYHNEAFRWATVCFDSISTYGSTTDKSQASKVYHLLSTHKNWALEFAGSIENKYHPSSSA